MTEWLYLCDITKRRQNVQELLGHSRDIMSLAFESGGRYLASGSLDQTVRLWDLRNLEAPPRILQAYRSAVNGVAINSLGSQLASIGADGLVLLWDLSEPTKEPRSLNGHDGSVESVAFDPEGRFSRPLAGTGRSGCGVSIPTRTGSSGATNKASNASHWHEGGDTSRQAAVMVRFGCRRFRS